MNKDQLKSLAWKYVESLTEDNRYAPFDTELLITINFLRWLTKTHLIIRKDEIKEWVETLYDFMPTSQSKFAMKIGAKRLFGSDIFDRKEVK